MTNTTYRDSLSGRDVADLMVLGRIARARAAAAAAHLVAGYLATLTRRATGAIGRTLARIDRARKRHAVINQLGVLSDATLKDIGFHRSQLGSVAHDLLEGGAPGPVVRRRPACEVIPLAPAKGPAGAGTDGRIAA